MSTISIQAPTVIPSTRLRLTARGRRVLLALASAPIAAGIAFSALAGGSALASGEHTQASFETVTVMPGDTLWSIAADAAPNVDPREAVDAIMRLNDLPSGMIQAGTTIALPADFAG